MGNNLEFILKLTDHFSTAMQAAKNVSDNACTHIVNDINKANQSSRTMSASVSELRQRLEAVNQVRFGTRLRTEFNDATRDARNLERQIEKLESRGQKGGGSMIGSLISTAVIAAGATDIMRTGIEQRQVAGAINFGTGGHGAEAIASVKGINEKYGLSNEAGLAGFKTLAGGTKGMFNTKQQTNIYEGVGAGVAAMGLTADQAKLSFLALGQMASKGKVSAEELRGQLGEQIPGALGIAARAMGVSQAEFSKMLDTGQIMSKDFLPKFSNQMKNEFGPAAIEMAKGPQAELNRFNNKILELKTSFSEQLMPAFMPVLTALKTGADWFSKNSDIMVPLAVGIGAVVLATSGWSAVQGIWNTVMNANPILRIITLVILVGSVIWGLARRYEGWGASMKALWEIIKAFVSLNITAWKSFAETVGYYIDYGKLKFQVFTEYISGAVRNLMNSFSLLKSGDFGGAKDALLKDIITPSSKALDELMAKHKASQAEFTKTAAATMQSVANNYAKIGLKKIPGAAATNPLTENTPDYTKTLGGLGKEGADGKTGKSKADSINSGGQRSIVINIGKMVEKIEMNVLDGKEGAQETASLIREEVLRMFYSMNGSVG